MARLDKLAQAFKNCNGPYSFKDFEKMILAKGYALVPAGQSGGSRRRYINLISKDLIMLDEPHDGEMGPAMVKRLKKQLVEKGAI